MSACATTQTIFDTARSLVAEDFAAVDALIQQHMHADASLLETINNYVLKNGGKRLRPLLALLMARATGYQGQQHIILAAVVEALHTATLLHDDVVDASQLRRGQKTANTVWDNRASVLSGDYLMTRAMQMLLRLQSLPMMAVFTKAASRLAEGEMLQLMHIGNTALTEELYTQIIDYKTAALFSATTELASMLSLQPLPIQKQLADYGTYLGRAFQIIDDILDYQAEASQMGKNGGDDLGEGKLTLPLILTLQQCKPAEALVIKQAINTQNRTALNTLHSIIERADGFRLCYERATHYVEQARATLCHLPTSDYCDALSAILDSVLTRTQ